MSDWVWHPIIIIQAPLRTISYRQQMIVPSSKMIGGQEAKICCSD